MDASFEPLAGILRLHPDGKYGTPFDWSCPVQAHAERPTLAVLKGLAGKAPPKKGIPAMAKVLMEFGFTRVAWQRRKNGKVRWVEFELASLIPSAKDNKGAEPTLT